MRDGNDSGRNEKWHCSLEERDWIREGKEKRVNGTQVTRVTEQHKILTNWSENNHQTPNTILWDLIVEPAVDNKSVTGRVGLPAFPGIVWEINNSGGAAGGRRHGGGTLSRK